MIANGSQVDTLGIPFHDRVLNGNNLTNLGHNTLARFILPANANQILTSHGCFRSKCFTRVEHSSTVKNYLLRICDLKICIAIAFAGSMNRVLV